MRVLTEYLTHMWTQHPRYEQAMDGATSALKLERKIAVAPRQQNHCDCGVFVCHYIKKWLDDPPLAALLATSPTLGIGSP